MIPGETIASGASPTCSHCKVTPVIQVYSSNTRYYIGTWCDCGPYSRESGYYPTREIAQAHLNSNNYSR